ncbi:hypothetical protein C1N74_15050 [Microbacterium sp. SGAir0570]|uniref:Uncharacterized protein n=1 Tax=Microbacterium paludicola TaxID=300019 RepID=A0ABU1I2M3_9MICO|nr:MULTISPECIES: hypothetical protein [Microbacterium]MDR6167742.1 hypothetical protein [Microbacterium paludicola]QCR41612.1 hypothetical protein C1N74_15050 [Microbacterium sp. SGAir0570]
MSASSPQPPFFRPVEPREIPDDDHPPLDMPAWMGPPWHVAPVIVALDREVGRSPDTVVSLELVRVYREGVVLRLGVRVAETGRLARQRIWGYLDRAHGRGQLDDRFDPTGLRWGVRFADGRTITTQDDSPWARGDVTDAQVEGPVLEGLGRPQGHADSWAREFWVWPTPPVPTFEVGVEWPARGIPETVTALDAAALRNAAARAHPLWP